MPPATGYASATPDNPGGAITGFSFYIDLADMPASWWTAAENVDATRGRVFRNDGSTELACDWVAYDHSGNTGQLRFKDDAAASATTYRIYPPVSGNATVAASDTYGSDNAYATHWEAYWPEGGGTDRTSHGNDATAQGGVTIGGASGKDFGTATLYDGNNDSCKGPDVNALDGISGLTWMGWVKTNGTPDALDILMGKWNKTASNGLVLEMNVGAASQDLIFGGWSGGSDYLQTTGNVLPDDTWTHVVGWYDGTQSTAADRIDIYINGSGPVAKSSTGTPGTTTPSTAYEVSIGADNAGQNPWPGWQSETQVHSATLSGNWMTYEYNQTNDNTAFWNTWTWTAAGGGDPEAGLVGGKLVGGGLLLAGSLVR